VRLDRNALSRWPVSLNNALATLAPPAVPNFPDPDGGALLGRICTSVITAVRRNPIHASKGEGPVVLAAFVSPMDPSKAPTAHDPVRPRNWRRPGRNPRGTSPGRACRGRPACERARPGACSWTMWHCQLPRGCVTSSCYALVRMRKTASWRRLSNHHPRSATPFTKPLCSASVRNAIAAATSCAWANRHRNAVDYILLRVGATAWSAVSISVLIQPGQTALTRTPRPPHSARVPS